MGKVKGWIAEASVAYHEPVPPHMLTKVYYYHYIENVSKEYVKRRLSELENNYRDTQIIAKVLDEKIFAAGDLTRTQYHILKCDDGNTYIHKFRVEWGGSWSFTVRSQKLFEEINSYEDAREAFTKSFTKDYSANCAFLIP